MFSLLLYLPGMLRLTLCVGMDATFNKTHHTYHTSDVVKAPKPPPQQVDSKALVVVNCHGKIPWLDQVPSDWRLVVYQKCSETLGNLSRSYSDFREKNLRNIGPEECTAYFDYMLANYDDLTDITLFLHDDSLMSERKRPHTHFKHFSEIEDVVNRFFLAANRQDREYMSLGAAYLVEDTGGKSLDPYHTPAMRSIWPLVAARDDEAGTEMDFPEKIGFQPGAQVAVHKERIRAHPRAVYEGLKRHVLYGHTVPEGLGNVRMHCCAIERMWHIILGEPAILPGNSIASDLLNITKCSHPDC